MFANRILEHGQITNLSHGFNRGGKSFQVLITAKQQHAPASAVINCKLQLDKVSSPLAFPLDSWSLASVSEIEAESLDLTQYDLFWGSLRD